MKLSERRLFLLALVCVAWAVAGDARGATAEVGTGKLVRLRGRSLCDERGPFLGLGASYFQALRHAKYERVRLDEDLALLASKGFNYVRILSMVSWDGLEIAPVTFTNRQGRAVERWPDYWEQFGYLLEAMERHGLRVEVTVFADAQYVMPSRTARERHLDGILTHIAGREARVMYLEVANEAWQNGFPGVEGVEELRAFTRYLSERTQVLVAITWNGDTSSEGISRLYHGSGANLATVHLSRDTRTVEGGWLPVRDAYWVGVLGGVPPAVSNEPIGPGSSVASETDPVKLCAAAVFAYLANLPAYVFHAKAGIYGYANCCPPSGGELRFGDAPGLGAFEQLRELLPPDVASWTRNDGIEASAPFTVFCGGQANSYWPEVTGATDGCVRNIGTVKDGRFVCFPMGILKQGVELEARRGLACEVYEPMTGEQVSTHKLVAGMRLKLTRGQGAWVIKGKVD